MHTDEAVQGVKFGDLLENNSYRYDRGEYHGPTLYYFTLIPSWIKSAGNITEIDETTLRIVPVVFCLSIVILVILLLPVLNWSIVLISGILTATSPIMVFYSRYYIQEILLVFFTFAAIVTGYRYIRSRHIAWAVCAGLSLGLLHATKETSIIAVGAIAASLFLVLLFHGRREDSIRDHIKKIKPLHFTALLLAMFTVSALFYSSFLLNPSGILDSFLTYIGYLNKASNNSAHIHPWYYYIKMLLGKELFVVILAALGITAIVFKKCLNGLDFRFLRFFLYYTIIMMFVYSIIPYKTPWNMLGFYHGFLLLGAAGAFALFNLISNKPFRILFVVLLITSGLHFMRDSYLTNFKYYADPSNPYVYGHTSEDIFGITARIKAVVENHPLKKNMFIEVVCSDHDYWPLPWYLRSLVNTGWWHKVDDSVSPAPVIIASPSFEPELIKKMYDKPPPGQKNLYVPLFDDYTQLRPGIEIRGYVVKELMDKYLQQKTDEKK